MIRSCPPRCGSGVPSVSTVVRTPNSPASMLIAGRHVAAPANLVADHPQVGVEGRAIPGQQVLFRFKTIRNNIRNAAAGPLLGAAAKAAINDQGGQCALRRRNPCGPGQNLFPGSPALAAAVAMRLCPSREVTSRTCDAVPIRPRQEVQYRRFSPW